MHMRNIRILKEGKNADYIKELANVDPNIYGIAIVTVDGQVFTKGDLDPVYRSSPYPKYLLWPRLLKSREQRP